MKTNELRNSIILLLCIALFSISFFSCGTDEDDFSGEWKLKSIESECEKELIIDTSVPQSDYCLNLIQTDSTETFVLTTAVTTCFLLDLDDSGTGTMISGDGENIPTKNINYTVSENNLVVCDENNICQTFTIVENALVLDIMAITMTGELCNRIFTLEK